MIIWRYPYGKYDFETLQIMFSEFCARAHLNQEEVIALPDDITIQNADKDFLLQLRQEINTRLHRMNYQPKCQFNQTGPKPCELTVINCEDCDEYYSDDDTRW